MAPAPRPLRSAPALALAAAAAALTFTLPPAAASAAPAPAPACGGAAGTRFPLDTRISGGPADYPAGGAFRSWELEVRNTTGSPCTGVHPVLVLADEERVLRPEQIRLEFYDGEAGRWRAVAFEATEEAESVGAFTGFDGFTVPARRAVTVPVRLAFRADAVPDEVVVNAALVQRRGADGDWVGRSGDYRLTIGPPDPSAPAEPTPPGTTSPAPEPTPDPNAHSTPTPTSTPSPTPTGTAPPSAPAATPAPDGTAPPRTDTAAPRPRPELAHTGPEDAVRLAPWAAALALAGALLTRAARRPRP
ncbi:hypothetical protein [Streptomyces sp. NPDC057854]|uniref:hypothetical protein n=1 Tax=unclassified Streptomyces TaxID=2593676 RepID=UPI0036778237